MDFKLIDVEISLSIFLIYFTAICGEKNYEVRSCGGVPGAQIQSTRGGGTLIAMSRRTGGRFREWCQCKSVLGNGVLTDTSFITDQLVVF